MKAVYQLPVRQGIVIPVSDKTPLSFCDTDSFNDTKVNWIVDSEGHLKFLKFVELEISGAQIKRNPNGAILSSYPELEDFAFRVIACIANSVLIQTGLDAIDPTDVRYGTPCIFPETPDEEEEFAENPSRTVRNTLPFTIDVIIRDETHRLDGKKVEALARDLSRLNEEWKQEVNRAIDWFRQGFKNQNILDQFLCYWNATELLAGYWYKQRKGEIKKGINQKIVDYWKQKKKYYKDNCFVIPGGSIRKFVEGSHNIANPVREKINFAFHSCFSEEEAQKNVDVCFNRNNDEKKSLKDWRDDIAHANVFASDKEVISKVRVKVPIIKEIAQNFICNTVKKVASE